MAVVRENQKFRAMLKAARKAEDSLAHVLDNHVIIGLDPGETTGMCIYLPWRPGHYELKQIATPNVVEGMYNIKKELPQSCWSTIWVVEDYKVYAWKADTHSWAGLHTPKLIGAIEYQASLDDIPIFFQMAQEAKNWATDEKLRMWDLYEAGQKHARDAERHVITWQFFGKLDGLPKPTKHKNLGDASKVTP